MKIKKVKDINYKIQLESIFYFLKGTRENTFIGFLKEPIKFLESLNLTPEQYSELANIIEEYGQEKKREGYDDYASNEDENY